MSAAQKITEDRLLDGQVLLRQGADGYRAGMDAVLLAAAIDARPGNQLVEFGCDGFGFTLQYANAAPQPLTPGRF